KTEIYKVLDKQPVYAVGPDIQQGYSMPCLACWATKPLDISTMKKLLALFDNEFEIINYINRNGANNILFLKNNNGDKDDNTYIQVSSIAKTKLEKEFQSFSIDTYLWANINTNKQKFGNFLEFGIDLFNCGVAKIEVQQAGFTTSCNNVINHSAKTTTSRWNMNITNCTTKGVRWLYSFNSNELYNTSGYRKTVNLQHHSGCWYTTQNMKGFCITIVQ
ncbi:695_t:CDS:2, partial [Scutellospora calospora]